MKILKSNSKKTKVYNQKKDIKLNLGDLKIFSEVITESLFRYRNHNLFPRQRNLMFIIFTFKSSQLLLNYILLNLKEAKKKKQYFFLNLLSNFLKEYFQIYSNIIKGIKIQIKGRINGSLRKKVKVIKFGKTSLQTLNSKIKHSAGCVTNKEGSFGVNVSIFY